MELKKFRLTNEQLASAKYKTIRSELNRVWNKKQFNFVSNEKEVDQ